MFVQAERGPLYIFEYKVNIFLQPAGRFAGFEKTTIQDRYIGRLAEWSKALLGISR